MVIGTETGKITKITTAEELGYGPDYDFPVAEIQIGTSIGQFNIKDNPNLKVGDLVKIEKIETRQEVPGGEAVITQSRISLLPH